MYMYDIETVSACEKTFIFFYCSDDGDVQQYNKGNNPATYRSLTRSITSRSNQQ